MTPPDVSPEQLEMIKRHVFDHLHATALCVLGSERAIEERGMSVQFEDNQGTFWTFTVIPAPTDESTDLHGA